MRYLTLAIIVISMSAYSQSIPKKAHTIILNDTISEQQLAEVLLSNGYSISSVNEYTLKTDQKRVKYWYFDIVASRHKKGYKLSVFMNSSISIYVGTIVTGDTRLQMSYKGMEMNANKVGFRELLAVASQFDCDLTFL